MGVQDRLNNVLQSRALPHKLIAPRYLATQGLRRLIGDPDLRQKAAGVELRQYAGIDLIGLDLACAMSRTCFGLAITTRLT